MKAVRFSKKRGQSLLELCQEEKPLPTGDQVLVQIHSASINAADYRSIEMGITKQGTIIGSDIAGQVEAVGAEVKRLRIGDEVLGDLSSCGFGGFAEYVAVSETVMGIKPPGVSFESAAALPMSAVTALQALRDKGAIAPGQTVLIVGAGGGVGSFCVQLAKYFGAEVTAVCGQANGELIKTLGADTVIDYTKTDLTKSDKRYDLILAINGSHSPFAYKRLLTGKGICVMVGGSLPQLMLFMLLCPFLSIGIKTLRTLAAKPNVQDLEYLAGLVEQGGITPLVDRHYPLSETENALRYSRQGHARGKVIIDVVR